jgi:catechol 2,3-dioxygenase-like lactoylglutathione lyase family enzyme
MRARSPAGFEKTARRAGTNVAADNDDSRRKTMLNQLANVQVWVHDQDEALAFYTEKLGLELREDVTVPEMGNFRWLSVGVPGQPDAAITLMAVPGPPVFDAETREQIMALMAKGAASGLFFSTDDIRATYEELKSRGVEFQQEPTEQPYGIDAGFRDPSGNQMRMIERR